MNAGFVVGAGLIAVAVLLLWWSRRRARAEYTAEVGAGRVGGLYRSRQVRGGAGK